MERRWRGGNSFSTDLAIAIKGCLELRLAWEAPVPGGTERGDDTTGKRHLASRHGRSRYCFAFCSPLLRVLLLLLLLLCFKCFCCWYIPQ